MLLAQIKLPLVVRDDAILIAGTRVRLQTVVYAFNQGSAAEEIMLQFPSLKLADIYAVIAYYLQNKQEVEAYIQQQDIAFAERRERVVGEPGYQDFIKGLIANAP